MKVPVAKLLAAVGGEIADEVPLALLDARHVHLHRLGDEAEFARAADLMPAMRRLQQRLRRHAAAQDAQAAHLAVGLDHGRRRAEADGGARRGVAGAAAADDDHVELGLAGL
ncbi:MAG: hypothetical protein WDO13_16250 [Verrucomicrobiota bacterium]